MALGEPHFDRLYDSVSLLFCAIGGVTAAILSFFVFPGAIPWFVMLLLVLCLGLYEFARIRAYVAGHSGVALGASCLALAIVCAGGLLDSGHGPDRWVRLASYWLVAGVAGYALILARSGGAPSLHRGAWSWFRKRLFPQGKYLAFDAVGTVLVAHVGLFLLGQLGSLAQVGSVRATTTLLSPVSLVFTGLTLSLTPVLARSDTAGKKRALKAFWLLIIATSVGATAVVALYGRQLIEVFFGASAVPPDATLIVAVASVVMFSVGAPLLAQVRVRGTYFSIAIVRVITGGSIVLFIIASANADLGLVFFAGQLGQAALICAAAFLVLRRRAGH